MTLLSIETYSDSYFPNNSKSMIVDTLMYRQLQDSIFNIYSRLNVSARSLFQFNLKLTDDSWQKDLNIQDELPYQLALRSLDVVPSEAFIPSGVERVLWNENVNSGLRLPTGLAYPQVGLRVPLKDIAVFLGMMEDTSPVINYSTDYLADIEIVVYSVQAKVIATLYTGKQSPGHYTLTWNFRNDSGQRMPSGDYIAEVRIGNAKYIRKRIVIP